jgi:hypothetical protein
VIVKEFVQRRFTTLQDATADQSLGLSRSATYLGMSVSTIDEDIQRHWLVEDSQP